MSNADILTVAVVAVVVIAGAIGLLRPIIRLAVGTVTGIVMGVVLVLALFLFVPTSVWETLGVNTDEAALGPYVTRLREMGMSLRTDRDRGNVDDMNRRDSR